MEQPHPISVSVDAIDWLGVVRAEYVEMPGLQLTLPQARRLWGLDERTCAGLFKTLVDARFLRQTPSGTYVRADIH